MIEGDIKWLPIFQGPAALAGMKVAGAYAIVNGVGNPPVTTAIADDLNLKVVWARFYDNAGFVLDGSLSPDSGGQDVRHAAKRLEDFAFNGWLAAKGLAGKVKLVGLERQAMVAAFKTKAIAGGMNSEPGMGQMVADGGKLIATTREMGELGYPALDVVTVDADFAAKNPDIVQGYVCAQYEPTSS